VAGAHSTLAELLDGVRLYKNLQIPFYTWPATLCTTSYNLFKVVHPPNLGVNLKEIGLMTKHYCIDKPNTAPVSAPTQTLEQLQASVKEGLMAVKAIEGQEYAIKIIYDTLGQKLKPWEMDESECIQILESGKLQ